MVAEEQPVKATGGLINRVRLQLAGEFPEAMEFSTEKEWGREVPGIVNWLNGDRTSRGAKIWENRYTVGRIKRGGKMIEVSGTIGIGISSYTLLIGRQLLEVSQAILSLENAIEEILGRDEYKPYIDAMESMNFSTNMKAVWLTRVYPFSKFLDIDGRERTNKRLSNNGRWCTHNQSLAQFKAALGAAIDVSRSGQSKDGMAPTRAPKGIHKKKRKKTLPQLGTNTQGQHSGSGPRFG